VAVKRAPVEVHVDELVLHGVAPGDRARVLAAVRARIAQIAADPQLVRGGNSRAATDRVDAGVVNLGQARAPRREREP
jgi:hypothetical protein